MHGLSHGMSGSTFLQAASAIGLLKKCLAVLGDEACVQFCLCASLAAGEQHEGVSCTGVEDQARVGLIRVVNNA